MKVLLGTNASYMPTRGGSTWCNRVWLERLAANRHACKVISPMATTGTEIEQRQLIQESAAQDIPHNADWRIKAVNEIVWNGVDVCQVSNHFRISEYLKRSIRDFAPDWALISSEDFGQALLKTAMEVLPERTIYLAHTPQLFPFGPVSLNPNVLGTQAIAAAAEVIVISNYTRRYFEDFLHRSPLVIHPPVYGPGPFHDYGNPRHGLITMINPCAVKGISIFLAIAKRLTSIEFAALPGWGTSAADLEDLRAAEVRILPPCRHIDDVLSRTRILLVPSLWQEGFGLVAVEAMLRGIPVLSSDLGGLPEATLGTRYTISVEPIRKYLPIFDEHLLPLAEVPEQNVEPWCAAINELIHDPALYRLASEESRNKALYFINNLNPERLEMALTEMLADR